MEWGPCPILVSLLEPQALTLPSAEWRGGAPQPSGSFPPVFVLAESCLRIFEACSVKAGLEESGRRITEEGEGRGLSGLFRGSSDSLHGAQPQHHGASQ